MGFFEPSDLEETHFFIFFIINTEWVKICKFCVSEYRNLEGFRICEAKNKRNSTFLIIKQIWEKQI